MHHVCLSRTAIRGILALRARCSLLPTMTTPSSLSPAQSPTSNKSSKMGGVGKKKKASWAERINTWIAKAKFRVCSSKLQC
uniref:Secreted protein n=1 Tax=Mycena chlorophos TaxID=658473 RepID=A0ABQ0KWH2_MYCCL|nr:predicted protein [Mycena chlorophos]